MMIGSSSSACYNSNPKITKITGYFDLSALENDAILRKLLDQKDLTAQVRAIGKIEKFSALNNRLLLSLITSSLSQSQPVAVVKIWVDLELVNWRSANLKVSNFIEVVGELVETPKNRATECVGIVKARLLKNLSLECKDFDPSLEAIVSKAKRKISNQ